MSARTAIHGTLAACMLATAAHAGGGDPPTIAYHNFPEIPTNYYATGWPEGAVVAEEEPLHGQPCTASLTLPPLGAVFLRAPTP